MTRREFCLGLSSSLATCALGDSNVIRDYTRYSWRDYESDLSLQGREATWIGIRQYVLKYGEAKDGILQVANFPMMYEYALSWEGQGLYRPCMFSRDLCRLMASQFRIVSGFHTYFINAGVGDLVDICLTSSGGQNFVCNIIDDDILEAGICRDSILAKGHQLCSIVSDCEFPRNSKVMLVLADGPHLRKFQNRQLLMKLLNSDCASVILCPSLFLNEFNLASVKRNMHIMTISPKAAYDSDVRLMSQLAILTVERRV